MAPRCKNFCTDEAPISPHNTKKFNARCVECGICYNTENSRCYCCHGNLRKFQLVHKEGRAKRLENVVRY